ncbi:MULTISPECIES: helix-turn-helix domain-containing protein [unclassified Sporosarcina]|uniref:helix-turn-helix domain-containing protein n=1 Tax=unclassified Sporosarcina TaxID=2647733 RepID=UPI00203FD309|nr:MULTISPECIES: helix-turn-helix transcriptional regulator [unclassified Sporosarcina]GKV63901.1 transcriptional regulator [Sporosarcina sp. NCCP-2331]GLB54681.1 transcriptional regulator [Sporosarcina sp. NCCP-2378]
MLQIGKTILRERKRRQITQDTLAAYCRVSKASVSKWEKEQSYPDITLLPKIAAYFEMTVDELLGYERQLSKEEIQNCYHSFAERFGKEPFDTVLLAVEEKVKDYYHEPALLLQMSILLLNHHMLSTGGAAILQRADEWLERIRNVSEDVWMLRQANTLQATAALMQADPETTLRLLDGVVKPMIGDEMLLAKAYEQVDNKEEAKRVIQVMMFQNILQLVGSSPLYLSLSDYDSPSFTETLRRTNGLVELYSLRKLHPNVCLQFYYGAAQCAALNGDRKTLYTYLTRYVEGCVNDMFPFSLRGDAYFDLLEDWLTEQLDLGTSALRNTEVIKQSMIESMDAPFFESFQEDQEMQELRDRLRWGLEEQS